jgi:hypothetical protein
MEADEKIISFLIYSRRLWEVIDDQIVYDLGNRPARPCLTNLIQCADQAQAARQLQRVRVIRHTQQPCDGAI